MSPVNTMRPTKPLRNLHVDNLPAMKQSSLRSLFAPYGRITRCRVVTTEQGQSAGYAFVMFEHEYEARHAMSAMDHVRVFSDWRIDEKQQIELNDEPSSDESLNVTKLSSLSSSPGCDATLLWSPPSDAVLEHDGSYRLSNGIVVNDRGHVGKRLRVSLARQRAKQSAMPPMIQCMPATNTNLYISSLPPHYAKQHLDALFRSFGNIIDSRILLDRTTGNSRCVGFVRFDNRYACELAIGTWNGRTPSDATQPLSVRFAVDRTSNSPQLEHQTGPFINTTFHHPHYDMSSYVLHAPSSPSSGSPMSHLDYDSYPSFLSMQPGSPRSPLSVGMMSPMTQCGSPIHQPLNSFMFDPRLQMLSLQGPPKITDITGHIH